MAAVLDQATVWQQFDISIPDEVKVVLTPHIIGAHAELHRYANATEKLGIDIGPYDDTTPTTYAWPSKQSAVSVVDLDYVQVYIDAALLRYFQHIEGAGGITIGAVGGYTNRIVTSATNGWKANGASYPRNALLGDRDVEVGDVVHLLHSTSEQYTTVQSLIATPIAAITGAASADAANPATQSASTANSQTAGTDNDVNVDSVSGTSYNGLADGTISETYTCTVTQGSTGGDATTARLSVVSGSGLDNQASVTPAAFGAATSIGTRGLTVTWDNGSDNYVVGQTWLITVNQAFTKPVATSAGTYTGTTTQTYIVRVTLGARYADSTKPQISVTSNLGIDQSGPTNVNAASTAIAVGTAGVTISFSGTVLRYGDVYYITATAPGEAAYKTIQLADSLIAGLQGLSDMQVDLCLARNITVPEERVSDPPTLNWEADQGGILINSGLVAYDSSLTSSGELVPTDVVSGTGTAVYTQYRAWMPDYVQAYGSVTVAVDVDPTSAIEALLGTVAPDNPLAYGVYKACQNANGQTVNFTAVADPSVVSDWSDALTVLVDLPVASIVPLTQDSEVNALVQTFVDTNTTQSGGWVVCWLNLAAESSVAVVDSSTTTDAAVALATLKDNPAVSGTQYTYLQCTSANAKFTTRGVRAGDTVRYLYSIDAFGSSTWTDFTVSTVVNEDTLVLTSPGSSVAVNTAQKFEIWRTPTRNEIAQALADQYLAFEDKLVRCVWPDYVDTDDGSVAGYFLSAGLAGFVAGIAPHQGIQGIPLTGFTGASRSVDFFSNGQLNILATAGGFVVTQVGSDVLTRNAQTTDQSSVASGTEVMVRNDNAIQWVIHNRISAQFDITNLTDGGLTFLYSQVQDALQVLQSRTFVQNLGNMVTTSEDISVRPDVTNPSAVVVQGTITRPFPVETLQLNLSFN